MAHHGHRGYPITRKIREARAKDAQVRQAAYASLTDQEKLVRLGDEPAIKQRLRLANAFEAQRKAAEEARAKTEAVVAKAKTEAKATKAARAKRPLAPVRRRGFYMGMRDE